MMDRISQLISDFVGREVVVDSATLTSVVVLVTVLIVSAIYLLSKRGASTVSTESIISSNNKGNSPPKFTPVGPAPANDVWEERRKRGISKNSSKKNEQADGKPFGSSYYYAHNSSNAKGGYSDGLQMEDFTMNGPRLLAKNGVAVDTLKEEEAEGATEETTITSNGQEDTPPPAPVSLPSTPQNTASFTLITKYLWDDPGDASGVATIRIDELPPKDKSTSTTISWKDANIVSVDATLQGEGLLVVATDDNQHEYRLQIKRLYDNATEVRTVQKAKRLLVKIHKRRGGHLNFLGKSNLEPWPHPQRK
ncbi:p21 protein (Cdc42 Rac)-activated kinase [Seminavis robusta]|uniref:P21 protein (Cdc42 Rac)-activated kinase n=1 Tax=Seminavis robusta TaxID=568900 RepID=A0A9N8D4D4_9STRA|nr:p21 protein (Cdc42 Rac)-activated kinase [Seminavis robusta]|eukprot:Sro2_g001930.1 p21 protein (Cdc42 Rac)-activated kinase (308) ;mRNA; r:278821-279744